MIKKFYSKLSKNKSLNNVKNFADEFLSKVGKDHISAFSAQTTFFLLISFFPFVIIFITLTQYLHLEQNMEFLHVTSNIIPSNIISLLNDILQEIYSKTGAVISVSVVTLLWSASKGINAFNNCFNDIYNIKENKNYFFIRFLAIIYTVVFISLLFLSIIVFVFGTQLYFAISKWLPNSLVSYTANNIINIRSAVGIIIFFLFFVLLYRFLPNKKIKSTKTIPGALFATLGWLCVSFVFSAFVNYITRLSYIYGSLSGVVITLLWLYFCIYIVFIGAEINYFYQNKSY